MRFRPRSRRRVGLRLSAIPSYPRGPAPGSPLHMDAASGGRHRMDARRGPRVDSGGPLGGRVPLLVPLGPHVAGTPAAAAWGSNGGGCDRCVGCTQARGSLGAGRSAGGDDDEAAAIPAPRCRPRVVGAGLVATDDGHVPDRGSRGFPRPTGLDRSVAGARPTAGGLGSGGLGLAIADPSGGPPVRSRMAGARTGHRLECRRAVARGGGVLRGQPHGLWAPGAPKRRPWPSWGSSRSLLGRY